MSAARVAAPTLGDGTRRSEEPAGLLYGSGAYAIWGMFPAFFGLLSSPHRSRSSLTVSPGP